MTKQKELLKNTVIILLGKISTQFVSFLLLPLYTSVLPTSDYGMVDLVTTYIGLLAPLVSLQLENAIFRFLIDARNDENKKKMIITNAYITVFFVCMLMIVLFIIFSFFINVQYKFYILTMILAMIFSNITLQTARGNGNNIDFSVGSVIAGASTIILNVLFLVVFKTGIIGMFLSLIIANVLCGMFLVIKEKIYLYIDFNMFNRKPRNKLLKYSLPLIPNGLMWWIINVSDRTIISIVMGTAANGIYSVSNKFSNIIVQIYNIFNLSWTESASVHIEDEDRDVFFSKTIQKIFEIFATLSLIMIAGMPILFPIFVNENYNDAYNYIPILVISSLLNVFVGLISVIYVAKKMTKKIAQTSMWAGIINLVINLILIRYIGIYAAAISTAISFATMSIYRYIDIRKYVKIKLDFKRNLTILIMFIFTILGYYLGNIYIKLVILVVGIVYACLMNKSIIFYSIDILKKYLKKFFNKEYMKF